MITTFGLFSKINFLSSKSYIERLINRDGGVGYKIGEKTSLKAIYYYLKLSSLPIVQLDAAKISKILIDCYDTKEGLFKNTIHDKPTIIATYYAKKIIKMMKLTSISYDNSKILNTIRYFYFDDRYEFPRMSISKSQRIGAYLNEEIKEIENSRNKLFIERQVSLGISLNNLTSKQLYYYLSLLNDSSMNFKFKIHLECKKNTIQETYFVTKIMKITNTLQKHINTALYLVDEQNVTIESKNIIYQPNMRYRFALKVTSFNIFINPFLDIELKLKDASNHITNMSMNLDMSTGLYTTQNCFDFEKLGKYEAQYTICLSETNTARYTIDYKTEIYVSLPIDFIFDIKNEDLSEQKHPSATYGSTIIAETILRSGINNILSESTQISLTVFDSSNYPHFNEVKPFESYNKFEYIIGTNKLIFPGKMKAVVEVGDAVNGVVASQTFVFQFNSSLIISDLSISEKSIFGNVNIQITPATAFKDHRIFLNEQQIQNQKINSTAKELKTVDIINVFTLKITSCCQTIKVIEGIPVIISNSIVAIDFSTKIDDYVDYCVDFNYVFYFNNEIPIKNTFPIQKPENSIELMSIQSNISRKNNIIEVQHGKQFRISFFIIDHIRKKILNSAVIKPSLVFATNSIAYSSVPAQTGLNGQFFFDINIDATFPYGNTSLSLQFPCCHRTKIDIHANLPSIFVNSTMKFISKHFFRDNTHFVEFYPLDQAGNAVNGGKYEIFVLSGNLFFGRYFSTCNNGKVLFSISHHNVAKAKMFKIILRGENQQNPLAELEVESRIPFLYLMSCFHLEYFLVTLTFILFTFAIYLRYNL